VKRKDILNLLSRSDKWYLGGGGRLLWAPQFPLFLDSPGFWDSAQYFNVDIQPLFSWTLLDTEGKELQLTFRRRNWNPAQLKQRYLCTSQLDLNIEETRVVLPNDVAVATVRLTNRSRKPTIVHLIAWTAQESEPSKQTHWLEDMQYKHGRICFSLHKRFPERSEFQCTALLGMSQRIRSHAVALSEGRKPGPLFSLTPFYESSARRRLPNIQQPGRISSDGILFAAIHTELKLRAGTSQVISIGMAFGSGQQEAAMSLSRTLTSSPESLSAMAWKEYFSGVPYFECSDEYIMHYYWYRWYGLRLNTISASERNYTAPFVAEGIGDFRAPISYSAQCHILENRWQHTPMLARGSLRIFIENQRSNGAFPGYIHPGERGEAPHENVSEPFYHSNWGRALLELHASHPSQDYLGEVYDSLKSYVQYLDRERDEEVSGLYDVWNHYETGQEYMSRYLAVNPNADREKWGKVFRLKGVDATVYAYEVKRALAYVAGTLRRNDEGELWTLEADKIKSAILEKMWDPAEEMFFDVNPATGKRTMVKAAICFYPYFTDIVSGEHLAGLKKHLLNGKEFWTPFPVPSSSVDDPMFSAEPVWKGKRMNCPWNGRVWPMTNSHVGEAIAHCAIRFNDRQLKRRLAEFLLKFIRMMFFDGDVQRPNCFEHYNPMTGEPCLYRGIDDYQHSWVNDLILKYLCGIRPDQHGVIIDPLPDGPNRFMADNLFVRGRRLKIQRRGKMLTIRVEKERPLIATVGTPLYIEDASTKTA
jgi:hypothetical protein